MSKQQALVSIASRILTCGLVSYPALIRSCDRLIRDPHSSPAALDRIVRCDPILTALILSRANIAPPHGQTITETVPAMSYLGMAMVHGLLFETVPVPKQIVRRLAKSYAQAIATAEMAKLLLEQCRSRIDEDISAATVYNCGLLHDIGTMLAQVHYYESYRAAVTRCADSGVTFAEALFIELGLDSSGLGTLFAKHWHLPDLITNCIRFYARPEPDQPDHEVVGLIHIAHHLVRAIGYTAYGDPYMEDLKTEPLEPLHLTPQHLDEAIRQFMTEFPEVDFFADMLYEEVDIPA